MCRAARLQSLNAKSEDKGVGRRLRAAVTPAMHTLELEGYLISSPTKLGHWSRNGEDESQAKAALVSGALVALVVAAVLDM